MVDNSYTHVTIVLDSSSSMSSVYKETINNLNEFIDSQKEVGGKCTFTLLTFSTVPSATPTFDFIDIHEVPKITYEHYVPYGMTALYDAIGKAVVDTGKTLSSMSEDIRPGKVITVIITDGQENASREFDVNKIRKMIDHQKDVYSWEFMFLGANIDVAEVEKNLNTGNAYSFQASPQGMNVGMIYMNRVVATTRSGYGNLARAADLVTVDLSNDDSIDSTFVPTPVKIDTTNN